MTLISINLDGNTENMVCAGQIVIGHVHIEATKRIKMRGVRLEVHGDGQVHWTIASRENETHYQSSEIYMNLEIYLTGSRTNRDGLYIQPGGNDFPFSFTMPHELPQSYESCIGNVRYTAKAVVDRRIGKNKKTEIKLTVIRLSDLNKQWMHLREPISEHNSGEKYNISMKGLCCNCNCCRCKCDYCCCCLSGVVETNLKVNRGCFAPGDTILVEGEIRNISSTKIHRTSVCFYQKTVYFDGHKRSSFSNHTSEWSLLDIVNRPGLAKGQTERFQNIEFRVPFVPPSSCDGCNIIDIVYSIELNAHYCVLTNCVGRCEVLIGNVPLQDASQPPVVTSQPVPFQWPV